MRLTTVLPTVGGLIAGYVLGTTDGRARHREITTGATTALSTAVHHVRVQRLLFDLAGRASSDAARIPGPGADLVGTAAAHLHDTLTQPDHEADRTTSASTPAEPTSERHVV